MKKILALLLLLVTLAFGASAQAAIAMPDNLTNIDDYAFYKDSSVTGVVTLPSGVTHIGYYAFAYTDVYALKIPAACTSIENYILSGTKAAYIMMDSYRSLSSYITSPVSYIFVKSGMTSATSGKYINMNYVVEYNGVYYLKQDSTLSPLCPVDRTQLGSSLTIPKVINGMPVTSLSKLVMPGCSSVRLIIPSYLTLPSSLSNPYTQQTYMSLSTPSYSGTPTVGTRMVFQVQSYGNHGAVSYDYVIKAPNGDTFTLYDGSNSAGFTPEVSGNHTLTVTATDAAGDTAETTLSFNVKAAMSIATPTISGNLMAGGRVTIKVSVTGAVGTVYYDYDIYDTHGNHYYLYDTTATTIYSDVDADGVHTLYVTATDSAGNTASTSTTFTVKPKMTISAPTVSSNPTVGKACTISVSVSGASSSLTYLYEITTPSGIVRTDTNNSSSFSFTPDAAGTHSVTVTATDSSGNSVTSTATSFAVKSKLTISAPTVSSNPTVGKACTISVSVSGASGTVSYSYKITNPSGSSTTYSSASASYSYTPSVAGTHSVTVTVTDSSGASVTSSSTSFTVKPKMTISMPTVSSNPTVGKACTISVSVSGASGTISYSYRITNPSGSSTTYSSTSASYSYTPSTAGTYYVAVTATDSSGNSVTSTATSFTVTGSSMTVATPTFSGSMTVGSEVTIKVSTTGASGTVYYDYDIYTPSGAHYYLYDTTSSTVYFTANETGSYSVKVTATDSYGKTASSSATFTVTASSAGAVKYRALLIGNTYPGTSDALPGPDNDIAGLKTTLNLYTGSNYSVTTKLNVSASAIVSAISSTFSGADSNDVSLFYYSGHGTSSGSLCGIGNTYISVSQLRQYLDQIPGTKIVLLDSCFSGAHINKDGTVTINNSSPSSFTGAVISAFSSAPKAKNPLPVEPGLSEVSRGNLATSGYVVLTACSKYETSESLPPVNNIYAGAFTYAVCYGSGYNIFERSTCTVWADSNKDGSITLKECYYDTVDTIVNYTSAEQSTQYYGDLSFVLWFK